jgi:hypothetical protein
MPLLRKAEQATFSPLRSGRALVVWLPVLALVAAATVITQAFAATAVLEQAVSVPTQEAGGYAFRSIALSPPDEESTVVISYIPEWVGGVFPGTKACTWTLRDEAGERVGAKSMTLTTMQASYDDPISTSAREVRDEPASATIACADERLDDPSGALAVADARVEPSLRTGSYVEVAFAYEWTGERNPTPQVCDVLVRDRSGAEMASLTGGLAVQRSTGRTAFPVQLPAGHAEAYSAEVVCRPVR